MMTKNKYLTYGIFALVIIGVIFAVGDVQQSLKQTPKLSLSYFYTTEANFYNVQIKDAKIIFMHTNYKKLKKNVPIGLSSLHVGRNKI